MEGGLSVKGDGAATAMVTATVAVWGGVEESVTVIVPVSAEVGAPLTSPPALTVTSARLELKV
jgi:hypothetical protein